MLNFNEALDTSVEEFERPPLLPVGTYRWVIEKHPSFDDIADGRFKVVDFQCRCLEAKEDVDEEALKEYGDHTNARLRLRFLISQEDEAAQKRGFYQLTRFLTEHLGLTGMSLKEGLAASVNNQFIGSVRWRPDRNDPEVQYAEFDRTAPVD